MSQIARTVLRRPAAWFAKEDRSQGLEPHSRHRLNHKIYQMVTSKTKAIMQNLFISAGKNKTDEAEEDLPDPKQEMGVLVPISEKRGHGK